MKYKLMILHGLVKFFESFFQVSIVIYISKMFPSSENLSIYIFSIYSPSLFFSIFLGSIVDRNNKKKLISTIIISNTVLGIATWFIFNQHHQINIYAILIVSFLFGVNNYLYKPLFKSITKNIYKEGNPLKRINSLQSTVSHSVSILGAFLSGIIMMNQVFYCYFVVSALFFLLSLYMLARIQLNDEHNLPINKKIIHDISSGFSLVLSNDYGRLLHTINCTFVYSIVPLVNFYLPYKVILILKLNAFQFSAIDSIYSAGVVLGAMFLYRYVGRTNILIRNRLFSVLILILSSLLLLISNNFYMIMFLSFICGFTYFIWGISISDFQERYKNSDQGKAISTMNLISTVMALLITHYLGLIRDSSTIEIILGVFFTITGFIFFITGKKGALAESNKLDLKN